MAAEFIGNVCSLSEPVSGVSQNGKAWKRWTCVMDHDLSSQYPRKVVFTILKEDVYNQLNNLIQQGQMVRAVCSIDAREYNGKWYNDITCFGAYPAQQQAQMGGYQQQPMQQGYAQPIGQPMPQQGFTAPAQPMTAPSQQPLAQPVPNNAGGQVQGQGNNSGLPF